jgi:alcohol dehydrogenase class IV
MNFDFITSQRIIFGNGKVNEIGQLCAGFGKRAIIFCGQTLTQAQNVKKLLWAQGIESTLFSIDNEPDLVLIQKALQATKEFGAEFIVSIGGGSVIDCGKAIAVLITNSGPVIDYLEVVGAGKILEHAPLPFIAVPTTAGTGSEVTKNAVILVNDSNVKVSLRSPMMLPKIALVDPELTYSMPPEVTASTGMDALAQVIEPFVCKKANVMTDLFCREGIWRAGSSLEKAYADGSDKMARENMAWTSLLGGLCLANAGLGAVHGFAAPLGGMFNAPHGEICARLLAPVVEENHQALMDRQPYSPILLRYSEVAQLLLDNQAARALDAVQWLEKITARLKIRRLSEMGVRTSDFDEISDKAAQASSMQANPIVLTKAELIKILEKAF